MPFERGLVAPTILAAILACAASPVDTPKLHVLKVHDVVMVTVKEAVPTNTNSVSDWQPSGKHEDAGTITYHVAATVVDVLPDGILALEARKSIHNKKGSWEYKLTGKMRPQEISPDRCALTEQISDLQISNVQQGELHDSPNSAWLVLLNDLIGLL
jgi:flagellar basal body L-ring protein FlgH